MKRILALSILLSLGFTATHSETKKINQLPVQQSVATSPHLTTRISWTKFPQPQYKIEDLKSQDRSAIIRVHANESGKVTKATVQESTGLANLDEILLNAVRAAKVKPYTIDDTAVEIIGYQTFNLQLNNKTQESCDFTFQSKNWIKQKSNQKTPFKYLQQPQLEVNTDDLNGYNRAVDFSFKVDKHGKVKKVKIKKGSGLYNLDQKVVAAVLNTPIEVKRTASTLWMYKKSNFKDHIQFNLNDCK
jgi:TonB family protein